MPKGIYRPFPWTPELKSLVTRMWLAGFSGSQIAQHVRNVSGITEPKVARCHVMGLLHRARVYRPEPGPVERRPKPLRAAVKRRSEGKWA